MERRRLRRRVPGDREPLSRMRLRTGRELAVLDVSGLGALVEGDTRLLPGTHVDVHVMTPDGRILVRSRIVRACVAALSGDRIRYRGALAFERFVNIDGYGIPSAPPLSLGKLGMAYPTDAEL
jgi:hypothetical protein